MLFSFFVPLSSRSAEPLWMSLEESTLPSSFVSHYHFSYSFVFGCGRNIAVFRYLSFHTISFFVFFLLHSFRLLYVVMPPTPSPHVLCADERWDMIWQNIEIVCATLFISNGCYKYTHFILSCVVCGFVYFFAFFSPSLSVFFWFFLYARLCLS